MGRSMHVSSSAVVTIDFSVTCPETPTLCSKRSSGLPIKIHMKFHVSQLGFSNVASDWLAAVLPANQMPGLKIFVK